MQTTEQVAFARQVTVRHRVDVCVVGGGPSGVAAAVTAARQGRSVFLAEGQGCFGGMGTAGGLPLFCYVGDGRNFLSDGIGREVHDRLWKAGGVSPAQARLEVPWDIIYKIEVLKRVYDAMVSESGAAFAFLTHCVGVDAAAGRVARVFCHGKSGLFAVEAKVFIDCTGDGDVCAWAGAPFEKGDADGRLQPGTLCSVWADIDWERVNAAGHGLWRQGAQLPRALADGVFTHEDHHLPGMIPTGAHTGGGNIGHMFGIDGTDERSMTEGLLWARKSLVEYERFYKEYLEGYDRMSLVATAALPGIRETRRILGDYVLNVEDFKRRAVFKDEIGRYAYPVDIHPARPGEEDFAEHRKQFDRQLRYEAGESYGIPYRCLTPRGLANVLVAGRCISADRYIQGSVRVMPGCFITGQAAGTAAAMAAESGADVHALPVQTLQARLKAFGAFLPNA